MSWPNVPSTRPVQRQALVGDRVAELQAEVGQRVADDLVDADPLARLARSGRSTIGCP
jgi:hypothetical protein